MLDAMHRVLLCMLEVLEGGLCLLEVLDVLEAVESRLCLLEALDVLEVMRCVLDAPEMLEVLEVPEAIRCVLLCLLGLMRRVWLCMLEGGSVYGRCWKGWRCWC